MPFELEVGTSCCYGPEVDSASNRNEYQESFLGVQVAGT